MSIPVNLFELLEDENDTEKKSAPAASKNQKAAPANAQQKKAEPAKKTDRPSEGKGKDTRGAPHQERRQQAPRDVADSQPSGSPVPRNRPPRQQQQREHHGERRENDQRPERAAHRQFDRRSGTGRGKEGKRGGAGRANWGTEEDDKKAQMEETAEPVEQQQQKEETSHAEQTADAKTENPEAQTENKEEQKDEDANLKTLDDYQKQIKRPTIALPPPRTVDAPTENLFVVKRDKEDQSHKKEKKEEKKEDSSKKVIPADQVIEFTRKEEQKSFRGRGRGGPRDSPRGNRGGKKSSPKSEAPNVADVLSFPALNNAVKA